MRRFVLKELLLISQKEKKAKLVSFHPQFTLLKGANSTGKSSLIKSIFSSLARMRGRFIPTGRRQASARW